MAQKTKSPPQLPANPKLDIGALSAFYKTNDTSYKFLWFLSVLELVEKSDKPLPADKIVGRMLDMAKPLIEKYRLRFGKKDRMESFLLEQAGARGQLSNNVRNRLLQFAPYRLLTPFFRAGELTNFSVDARHRYIRKSANSRFGGRKPLLYRFIGEPGRIEQIEIDPSWRAYLLDNIAVVRGWALWHWSLFLEARNPNRPNIAKQILPEANRKSIGNPRNFWRQVMGVAAPVKCLYSGGELSVNNFALDHYIPHEFIGHNRLWNLHPVAPRANSAKSDRLPHPKYFDNFIKQQQIAIEACRNEKIKNKKFALVEYNEGLNLDIEEGAGAEEIAAAYKALIPPLLTIARSYGFLDFWEYAEDI